MSAQTTPTKAQPETPNKYSPFHNKGECEYTGCRRGFFLKGGRHHCRVCYNSICNAHCSKNVQMQLEGQEPLYFKIICLACLRAKGIENVTQIDGDTKTNDERTQKLQEELQEMKNHVVASETKAAVISEQFAAACAATEAASGRAALLEAANEKLKARISNCMKVISDLENERRDLHGLCVAKTTAEKHSEETGRHLATLNLIRSMLSDQGVPLSTARYRDNHKQSQKDEDEDNNDNDEEQHSPEVTKLMRTESLDILNNILEGHEAELRAEVTEAELDPFAILSNIKATDSDTTADTSTERRADATCASTGIAPPPLPSSSSPSSSSTSSSKICSETAASTVRQDSFLIRAKSFVDDNRVASLAEDEKGIQKKSGDTGSSVSDIKVHTNIESDNGTKVVPPISAAVAADTRVAMEEAEGRRHWEQIRELEKQVGSTQAKYDAALATIVEVKSELLTFESKLITSESRRKHTDLLLQEAFAQKSLLEESLALAEEKLIVREGQVLELQQQVETKLEEEEGLRVKDELLIKDLRGELTVLRDELNANKRDVAELESALASAESSSLKQAAYILSLESDLNAAHEKCNELENTIGTLELQLHIADEKLEIKEAEFSHMQSAMALLRTGMLRDKSKSLNGRSSTGSSSSSSSSSRGTSNGNGNDSPGIGEVYERRTSAFAGSVAAAGTTSASHEKVRNEEKSSPLMGDVYERRTSAFTYDESNNYGMLDEPGEGNS